MIEFILQKITLQGLIWLIVAFPLATSAINWIFAAVSGKGSGSRINPWVSFFGVFGPFLSFAAALTVFWILTGLEKTEAAAITGPLFNWFTIGQSSLDQTGWMVDFALKADQLSMVMSLVVAGVGSLIHLYSIGYMAGDGSYPRYFAELNLFLFFMLLLVLADNLLLMFIGWEGVGLCSYLLISFWFNDIEKAKAGKKAFIVNRIGDLGFIVGIFLIWGALHGYSAIGENPFNFGTIERSTAALIPISTMITLALFIGATGKSAQIPLYIWLPDAMAGPTPVSALIHAATMVTAGVYMVARLNFLYVVSPITMQVVAMTGAITAFFAATMALVQKDIKKVLAYSTISQLGFMFLAEGVGAFSSGIFHLVTHSFFKAALFLAAGSVIHALHGEQDMFNMGGLKKKLPGTFAVFFVAALALSGIFPFAGFFSKDDILWQVYSRGNLGLWIIAVLTAGMTSFYIFRAVGLTFFGKIRIGEDKKSKIHESSVSMLVPLVILAILSFIGGWIKNPLEQFLSQKFVSAVYSVNDAHGNLEHIMAVISVLWAALWGFIAWIIYAQNPNMPAAVSDKFRKLYTVVSKKYYIDELYQIVFVKPIKWISENVLLKGVDSNLIDNIFVNGSGRVVSMIGDFGKRIQTGFIAHYIFFMIVGLCMLICFLVF